jgi:hypothetical protein
MKFFKKQYKTGLLGKDPIDIRDYLLSEIQPNAVPLPDIFNLRDKQSPVENQDGKGVCYAMAGCGYQEYWNSIEYKKSIDLSTRFLVWATKKISGLINIEADFFRNVLKAIVDYGIALESDYPTNYSLSWQQFIVEPPIDIRQKALEFKGKTYWRVMTDLDSIRQAIYQNKAPVLTGIAWYSSYNSPAPDGKLPLPSGNAEGHAILCVGWEYDKLWFKNSWGINWGNKGYFYIPFNEFSKHEIWDCWILLDEERPQVEMDGWVAEEYLQVPDWIPFKAGTIVIPITNLRLRKYPSIYAPILQLLNRDQKLEIVGEDRFYQNGYFWRKVKLIK